MREREAVLAAMTRTLGPTHADTLVTRHNLAASYSKAGDHDRAAREFEAVVEGYTATLGPRHVETLMAQANLGHARLQLGYAQGAVALLGALSGVENPAAKIDAAVDKLQRWQARVDNLQRLLTQVTMRRAGSPEPTSVVISRIAWSAAMRRAASITSWPAFSTSSLLVFTLIAAPPRTSVLSWPTACGTCSTCSRAS